MDVTLFEVHLPEAQFNAPFSSKTGSNDEQDRAGLDDSEGGNGGAIAVLAVVVGLGALAWFLSRRTEEFEEIQEPASEGRLKAILS